MQIRHPRQIDQLALPEASESLNLISNLGCFFKGMRPRILGHGFFQVANQFGMATGQQQLQFGYHTVIGRLDILVDARPHAFSQIQLQAFRLAIFQVNILLTIANGKQVMNQPYQIGGRTDGCKRTKVQVAVVSALPRDANPGEGFVLRDLNKRIGFVIFKQHIEPGLMGTDELLLQDQRVIFGSGRNGLDTDNLGHQ